MNARTLLEKADTGTLLRLYKRACETEAEGFEGAGRVADYLESILDARLDAAPFEKHLRGQHDQRSHGSGRGGGGKPAQSQLVRPSEKPLPPPPGAKTPFDTPAIIEAREAQSKVKATWDDQSDERDELRRQTVNKLMENGGFHNPAERQFEGPIAKERVAHIVLGPPASGKSTLSNPLVKNNRAMLVDADEAKALLPEFNKGRNAGAVHIESSFIVESGVEGPSMRAPFGDGLMAQVIDGGYNFVLPTVGRTPEKIVKMRDMLKAKGYKVHIHLVDASPETATRRAIARFEKTGRFVDPSYVYNDVGRKPQGTYDALKKIGGFDSFTRVNADGPSGSPPKVLERTGAR